MKELDEPTRKALEDRAKGLKDSRGKDLSAIVIEFAGSPKAGKTTKIDILCHFLKRMGFKVWAPTEGASKRTPYHLKRDLVAFNTWSLNYAISELLVAYHNIDRQDVIILDRGPFDSIAWMSLLVDRGELAEPDLEIIERFALLPKWSTLISRINLFTCSPQKSLDREHSSKLTHAPGTAMNPDLLSELLLKYNELISKHSGYPVQTIDTTETDGPLATALPIAEDTLNLLEAIRNVES